MNSGAANALPDWLESAARSFPERPALTFESRHWNFVELLAATERATAMLAPIWAGRSGRIGILAANRPGFIIAVHAARWLGAPIVPLNWRLGRDELSWQIREAGVSLLLVDAEHEPLAGSEPVERFAIARLEEPAVQASGTICSRTVNLAAEAAVLFTSGTGGRPKGARLTYGNFWQSAVGSMLHLGHRQDDRWLAALPLFHIGGLSVIFRGVIGAVGIELQQRFDLDRTLEGIDRGATLVSVVPTVLRRLIDARGETPWPDMLRCVLVGGAPAAPSLIFEASLRGLPVAPTYGLTEACSQVTTLSPPLAMNIPASSGYPLPITRVRITSDDGPAPPGEPGQIEIAGPTLFSGYLAGTGPLTHTTSDGWFRTGDLGYMDAHGALYVVDRRDDLIVSGGENVYPAEIERVLLEHPLVRDAGVVGFPHAQWGARPAAAVVWDGDARSAEHDLRQHCAPRLARFKIPDRITVLARLPRSASGKLLRRELRHLLDMQTPKAEADASPDLET